MKQLLCFCLLFISAQAMSQLPDFTDLVEQASPAVVNISTTQKTQGRFGGNMEIPQGVPDIFRHFFGENQKENGNVDNNAKSQL